MSLRSPSLQLGFVLMVTLGLLHFSAGFFYLYWVYWWFDVLMHFLAGFAGGLVTYWVLAESSWKNYVGVRSATFYTWMVFCAVMIVGIAWEIFEYQTGIIDNMHEGYVLDTISDLILDGAGALLAVFVSTRKFFKKYG